MPAARRLLAVSPGSLIAGLIRNQLTSISTTHPINERRIQVWLSSQMSSEAPTRPMPRTQTNVSAGSINRTCILASACDAPARRIDG